MGGRRLGLFQGVGIELEYMIVDADTLSVRPIADVLLGSAAGAPEAEVEMGPLAWSNELARHVVELKTNGPVSGLAGLDAVFQDQIREVNRRLLRHGARLLPTAMHPWMDPHAELELWPYEHNRVYQAFDRIFGCTGHGWANLQSCHINLSFADDAEFARLHAAIRIVLPIVPALAASSPLADGRLTGTLDTRMAVYRTNARRVPSVTGLVVPESAGGEREYRERILEPIYRDLAPFDPEGILRYEWVNARGAIARFDRGAIEIRVIDVQECAAADIAIAAAITSVVRAVAEGRTAAMDPDRPFATEQLAAILADVVRDADRAIIRQPEYLRLFGTGEALPAGELWRELVDAYLPGDGSPEWRAPLDLILTEGCLARRIVAATGANPPRQRLHSVYRALAECLDAGRQFRSDD